MKQHIYIVAVSGGVDSVVLLNMLINNRLPNHQLLTTGNQFIVAHFDHGIREESGGDADFVKVLAGEYGLVFELGRANLGSETSEAKAREVRYNFLRKCCKKYMAAGIITAHHQDDQLETAIINLIRGTGWRGLASLQDVSKLKSYYLEQDDCKLFRPFLNITKQAILDYADENNLKWKEDSTNADIKYLRNYVRCKLLPTMTNINPDAQNKLRDIIKTTAELKLKIATELQNISTNSRLDRYNFIMWPDSVAKEVIYQQLVQLDPDWHPSSLQITRALHFIKTALPGKQLEISENLSLYSQLRSVQFKKA
ncbi:tRNA lysidine(34) synthetase TilS [Candidatus Nomurabacteria bacterium]|jgi:tRNA(Ile)-lysidine synthetase-like protein|nr:tRNA lysidine(34) synthetase TilS [Candidatus Nomurabacteria bacterium]